ncbi:MAG: hypothetical protein P4N59_03355 [Negativicutes bacterium]|nr:hypothetical protein [Negativicutes bacterium]
MAGLDDFLNNNPVSAQPQQTATGLDAFLQNTPVPQAAPGLGVGGMREATAQSPSLAVSDQSSQNAAWYDQTWRQVKADHPDWTDEQAYAYMTNLISPPPTWTETVEKAVPKLVAQAPEKVSQWWEGAKADVRDAGKAIDKFVDTVIASPGIKLQPGPQGNFEGLVEPGNIDLANRPQVKLPDGSTATVASKSYNFDGKEVLLPTVSDDGRMMSDAEAVDTFRRTGRHLGIFASPEAATKYAQALHEAQQAYYRNPDTSGIQAEFNYGNVPEGIPDTPAEAAAGKELKETVGRLTGNTVKPAAYAVGMIPGAGVVAAPFIAFDTAKAAGTDPGTVQVGEEKVNVPNTENVANQFGAEQIKQILNNDPQLRRDLINDPANTIASLLPLLLMGKGIAESRVRELGRQSKEVIKAGSESGETSGRDMQTQQPEDPIAKMKTDEQLFAENYILDPETGTYRLKTDAEKAAQPITSPTTETPPLPGMIIPTVQKPQEAQEPTTITAAEAPNPQVAAKPAEASATEAAAPAETPAPQEAQRPAETVATETPNPAEAPTPAEFKATEVATPNGRLGTLTRNETERNLAEGRTVPWQVTLDEYAPNHKKGDIEEGGSVSSGGRNPYAAGIHAQSVKWALRDGADVPINVLKEYKDSIPQWEKSEGFTLPDDIKRQLDQPEIAPYNGKQPWEMTSNEYDEARAKEVAPDYKVAFMPKKKTGIEGRENADEKTITVEEGTDKRGVFSHELRHLLFDNVLKDKGQSVYNSERDAAQSYLKEHRPHDFNHPDNQSGNAVSEWQENSQGFIDEYFKHPDRLQQKLPGIYNFLNESPLKDYAKYDVSHKAIVEQALAEGKPVPENVLAEYPELRDNVGRTTEGGVPNGQQAQGQRTGQEGIAASERSGVPEVQTAKAGTAWEEEGLKHVPAEDREFVDNLHNLGLSLTDYIEDLKKDKESYIKEAYDYMKANPGGKGVKQGSLTFDKDGKVTSRVGRESNNPLWYQEYYAKYGRAPSNVGLRKFAEAIMDDPKSSLYSAEYAANAEELANAERVKNSIPDYETRLSRGDFLRKEGDVQDEGVLPQAQGVRPENAASPGVAENAEFKPVSAETFIAARDKSTKRPFLTPYTADEMKGWQHYLTDDGVGFALTPEKDMVGVFNNSGKPDAGAKAVTLAIAKGAKTADAIAGYLDRYYNGFGFNIKESVPWDDKLAPRGWDYAKYGRPNVVFLEYPENLSREPGEIAKIRDLARAAYAERLAGGTGSLPVLFDEHGRIDWRTRRGVGETAPDAAARRTENSGGNVNKATETPKGVSESERPSSVGGDSTPPVAPEGPMSEQLAKQLFGNQQAKFQAMENVYKKTRQSFRDIKQFLSPSSMGEESRLAGRSMRENLSDMARKYDVAEAALHDGKLYFDKVPEVESLRFIDAVERGQISSLDPKLQPIAKLMRDALNDRVREVRALGTGKLQSLIENYFPHIWKDPKQAETDFAKWFGKRPLSGSESFTKERSIPTTADGLKWRVYDNEGNLLDAFANRTDAEALSQATPDSRIGPPLQPVSFNPIDLTMLKLREMDKYIMAHKTLNELKGEGLAKLVRVDLDHPEGWVKIDDKISTVYNKAGKFNYWVHPDAAELINNYLSPGLRNGRLGSVYEGVRSGGNWLNQFQLGMSAFHLGFTSYDTIVSKLALAMKQVGSGQVGGALKSTGEALSLAAPITTALKGNKLLKEWYKPSLEGSEVSKILDALSNGKTKWTDLTGQQKTGVLTNALSSGGARARMDAFYGTKGEQSMVQEFKDIWKNVGAGNYRTAAGHTLNQLLPWNAVRIIPRLIMEEVVPRQKLGVAASMMEYELKKNPNMTHDQLREAAGKVWDSTDNRLGQLVYDNLFWNKALKDGLMLSVRSVGWNLGTVRELGGGVVDLGKIPIDLMRGKPAEFSHRTSYLAALTLATVISGAVIQKLATGKDPEDWRDYFFPQVGGMDKNGNPERISLPSYAKDVYATGSRMYRHGIAHGLAETAVTKTHPFFQSLNQLWNNKDYWGKEIVHPGDTLPQKAWELAKYAKSEITPFGEQGLEKIKESEGEPSPNITLQGFMQHPLSTVSDYAKSLVPTSRKQALPFLGIMPAPRDINKTQAEELATDINQQRFGSGKPRTSQQADLSDLESRIKRDLQSGNTASLQQAYAEGKLNKDQVTRLKELRNMTPLQQQIHSLDIDDIVQVYKAGKPQEQQQLKDMLAKKLDNKIKKGTPDEREKYKNIKQQLGF